jgi:hypothetical protein
MDPIERWFWLSERIKKLIEIPSPASGAAFGKHFFQMSDLLSGIKIATAALIPLADQAGIDSTPLRDFAENGGGWKINSDKWDAARAIVDKLRGKGQNFNGQQKKQLTGLMTKTQIAEMFSDDRRNVDQILNTYYHEKVGQKFRMQVEDMPPKYQKTFSI